MKVFIVTLALCLPAFSQTWFSNVTKTPAIYSCAVSWTTAVPTITHIEYGTVAGVYKKSVAYNTKFSRVKTATISGLLEGTTYHFRIDAADTNKVWVKSPDMYCTTKKKVVAADSVHLNWQASNSSGVTGYKVYRSTISGGYYALLGSVVGLTYTDQAVQHGITYFYAIKSINKSGLLSAYSSQVKAVIP